MKSKNRYITIFLLLFFVCFSAFADSKDSEALATRQKFIEGARRYLGTPYVYGGNSSKGIDCSGLIFMAAKDSLGITIPRTAALLCEYSRTISETDRQPGDLMFFSENGRTVSHVSIYIGDGQMIHAASDGPHTGVIISKITENYWKTHYFCSGRIFDAVKDTSLFNGTSSQTTPSVVQPVLPAPQTIAPQPNPTQPAITQTQPVTQTAPEQTGSSSSTEKDNDYVYVPGYHSNSADYSGAEYYSDVEYRTAFNDYSNRTVTYDEYAADPAMLTPSFLDNFYYNVSLSGAYSLFDSRNLDLSFRGINAEGIAEFGAYMIKPGLGLQLNLDLKTKVLQIPLFISLGITDYFSVYGGAVLTIGNPVHPVDETQMRASFFPGIFGVTAQTPALSIGKIKFRLYQDISYTVYTTTDGSALSFVDSLGAGLKFATGVRVTIPMF